MTPEQRMLMQMDDMKDTVQMSRLKKLFWDCENTRREYGELFPEIPTLQNQLCEVVSALGDIAKVKGSAPIAMVFPRDPMPGDRDGRLKNGPILQAAIAAHDNPETRISEKDMTWMHPKRK